eukprot:CAMPEP_0113456674 /NCGR_PEP_ID=MMETSP0014_2-20120614/9010_1 /TAXON_ID=2857 /ORGANISM="Nitzschia sp." /LENGTH=330 /DNA_ID=CAMNT_0000348137 /DNA_START=104 /DNA_END=1096 /DNA_ORIENTATION=+ /assembly_acc=CAM_ASM_000159
MTMATTMTMVVAVFLAMTAATSGVVAFTATPTPTTAVVVAPVKTTHSSKTVFQQQQQQQQRRQQPMVTTTTTARHMAGGFEWEDPTEAFDQGVENPYKNPDLMKGSAAGGDGEDSDSEGGGGVPMKIDPARLLGPRLSGTNLYLIGMMGTGKSAVGDKVARRMGSYNFLDTDQIIEQATGMTIPEIFDAEGEDGFRSVESQVLDTVHAYVRCVVSTGGGLVCRLENWGKLQSGLVVWLDVEPEIIMKRIEGTDRPLLQTDDPLQTLKDLLEERQARYAQADVRIEVTEDMDEDEVAEAIVRELHNYIDDNPPQWKLAKQKAQNEGLDWVK